MATVYLWHLQSRCLYATEFKPVASWVYDSANRVAAVHIEADKQTPVSLHKAFAAQCQVVGEDYVRRIARLPTERDIVENDPRYPLA